MSKVVAWQRRDDGVMVVTIDEPRGKAHFGGEIAAPVFAKTAASALRIMGAAPDAERAERLAESLDRSLTRAHAEDRH